MAVHHLEDIAISSEKRIVKISIYFSTARKNYLLYWNDAFWTERFSLFSVVTEINHFMKRTELPEHPRMEDE